MGLPLLGNDIALIFADDSTGAGWPLAIQNNLA
jgi:hypothetical protein